MNITHRIDKDILYIAVEGRVDAANAPEAEKQLFAIRNANRDKHVVIDAEALTYISSAGVRVILKLRKEVPKLAIINVSAEIYEIFDLTGFTEMLTIEKAFPRISVDGCQFIAKGANGAVYRLNEETIVKTYFSKDALPDIKQERENARRAFVLGVNTAIPYGIVRVGDGYGTVMELLNAVSVAKLIGNQPEDLTEAANYYIDMLKGIHAIEVKDGDVPDIREAALSWADFVAPHLPNEQAEKLHALFWAIPKRNTLLHGDYQPNNIMVQKGEPIIIDMDTLCMGHPIFELAPMFSALVGFSEHDHSNSLRFFGFSFETAGKFWELALKMYLGTEDEAVCRSVAEKAMVIGYVRMLRRALRRPDDTDSPAKIARCKEMLGELLSRVDSLVF